jgi:hypothetical protein
MRTTGPSLLYFFRGYIHSKDPLLPSFLLSIPNVNRSIFSPFIAHLPLARTVGGGGGSLQLFAVFRFSFFF